MVPCEPRRAPSAGGAPPSQALLDAFAILRRDRAAGDELPAAALKALRERGLTPVSPDGARLLRSAGDARAWVVPVPDVDRLDPFMCKRGAGTPREGVAVVAIGDAPAGGGGALRDLLRGSAPVAVDPCAGEGRDMLGVSGIVPDGVTAVFLTASDGTAVRADVKDNGFSFVVPRGRTPEPRYVVWTGSDGTPHVQPVWMFVGPRRMVCGRQRSWPIVTPTGAYGCGPFPMFVPRVASPGPRPFLLPRATRARQRAAASARQRQRARRRLAPAQARQRQGVRQRASASARRRQRARRRLARSLALRRSPVIVSAPCETRGPAGGRVPAQVMPPGVVVPAPPAMPLPPPRKPTP